MKIKIKEKSRRHLLVAVSSHQLGEQLRSAGAPLRHDVADVGQRQRHEGGQRIAGVDGVADQAQLRLVVEAADVGQRPVRMVQRPGRVRRVHVEDVQPQAQHQPPRPGHQLRSVPRAQQVGHQLHRVDEQRRHQRRRCRRTGPAVHLPRKKRSAFMGKRFFFQKIIGLKVDPP